MTEEKFKLPQSSYEELVKIIKGYGNVSQPASLEDVSKLIGMNPTVISRNAGFLIATGILGSGKRKLPTPEGKELGRALEHGISNESQSWWRKIVRANDFLSKLLTAIRIRNGMDEDTLEAHIAYSAGQPKRPQFMTGARTVVDILRAAGLISESDGKITSSPEGGESVTVESHIEVGPKEKTTITTHERALGADRQPPAVQITIQVNVNCTPDGLEDLGGKLRSVIDRITLEQKDPKDSA